MSQKQFISADQLLRDSYQLGLNILESGYAPSHVVGVWRGGTPVAIAVHELLNYVGHESNHLAIKTSLYTGIDQTTTQVRMHGLEYLAPQLNANDRLLLIDDVFDSGRSMDQIICNLSDACGSNTPEIRIATPYFKPNKNQTTRKPDYYLHETGDWLVFPHELCGLNLEEILEQKPGTEVLRQKLTEHN